MTQQVLDLFDDEAEFEELLDTAKNNAESDWEENFIAGMSEKFTKYGREMYLSDLQLEHINRIAGER